MDATQKRARREGVHPSRDLPGTSARALDDARREMSLSDDANLWPATLAQERGRLAPARRDQAGGHFIYDMSMQAVPGAGQDGGKVRSRATRPWAMKLLPPSTGEPRWTLQRSLRQAGAGTWPWGAAF